MTENLNKELSGSRLLVVDDDPIFCEFAESVLVRVGADVTVRRDGAEALEFLKDNDCDFAIVDLIMPNVDGLGLISILRNRPKTEHLPIAVVTSRRDEAARLDAERLGIALFLSKPIQWTQFAAQIAGALEETSSSIGKARSV